MKPIPIRIYIRKSDKEPFRFLVEQEDGYVMRGIEGNYTQEKEGFWDVFEEWV